MSMKKSSTFVFGAQNGSWNSLSEDCLKGVSPEIEFSSRDHKTKPVLSMGLLMVF
jgi:hypothetical protein